MRCLWRQCWDLLSLHSLQLASRPKHWDCLLFFFLFFHFFFFFFFFGSPSCLFLPAGTTDCAVIHTQPGGRQLAAALCSPCNRKKNPDLETNRQKKKNSKISRTKKTETNSWSHNCTLGVLANTNTNTTREKQSLCRIWFIGDESNREYFQSAMDGNPSRKQRLQPAGGAA